MQTNDVHKLLQPPIPPTAFHRYGIPSRNNHGSLKRFRVQESWGPNHTWLHLTMQNWLYGRVLLYYCVDIPHRIRSSRRNLKKIRNWDKVRKILACHVLIFWIMEVKKLPDNIGLNRERNPHFKSIVIKTTMM